MDALISFVPSKAMHAALAQHWNTKQSSQTLLLNHTISKAFLLTCHHLHSLQQKPIHHAQRLLIAVWFNMVHMQCLA